MINQHVVILLYKTQTYDWYVYEYIIYLNDYYYDYPFIDIYWKLYKSWGFQHVVILIIEIYFQQLYYKKWPIKKHNEFTYFRNT